MRQAALIAGFAYLLNPVTYAEYVYPKLVTTGNAEQTVQNISTHGGLFLAALFCYLVSFIGDVVIAWALYVLLAPVNRSLSLLTAWFQLVYAAVALGGLLNMVSVFRLLNTPEYLTFFGSSQLHGQVYLLGQFVSIRLGHKHVAFWDSSSSAGLLDLPIWLYSEDIRDFVGGRWIRLGHQQSEAVPFSECPSWIPRYRVPG